MPYADIHDYADAVRAELARSGLVSEASKVSVIVKDRKRAQAGTLRAYQIQFGNGATLTFDEVISIATGNNISPHKYSYHFQHGPFFFRYDKDTKPRLGANMPMRPAICTSVAAAMKPCATLPTKPALRKSFG